MTPSCTTLSEDIALLEAKTKELRVLSDELLTEGVAQTENIRARFHVLRDEAQAIDARIKETLLYLEKDHIAIESALAKFGYQGYKDVTEVNGVQYYLAFQNVEGKFAYSYISGSGKRLNEEMYQDIGNFSNGRAAVEQNDQYFFITKDGTPLSSERYDDTGNFSDGRARVMQGNEEFFINRSGKRIIPTTL
jgi:hypothetical protein